MGEHCALVTGATGYVGAVVASRLQMAGWHVQTAGRNESDSIWMDFSQPDSVLKAKIPSETIDVCIHVAAAHEITCANEPLLAMTINVSGTRALLDWCITKGIKRFIYISTFHVFGSNSGNLVETTAPLPTNDYGLTHLLAEETIQMFGNRHQIEYCILRPSNLVGFPRDWKNFNRWTLAPFDFCLQAIETGRIILRSSGKQIRNWVDLEVLSDFVILAAEGKCQGIRHVSGKDLSILDLTAIISNAWFEVSREKIEVVVPEVNTESVESPRHFTSVQSADERLPDFTSFVRYIEKHLRDSKTLCDQ